MQITKNRKCSVLISLFVVLGFCGGPISAQELIKVELIDLTDLKPDLKCVDFQKKAPTKKLKKKYVFGSITIRIDNGARIVQRPKPKNAHPWVPDPLHFLEAVLPVGSQSTEIDIFFAKPVKWVEINLARGRVDKSRPSSDIELYAGFENTKEDWSDWKTHDTGSTVKTMKFTYADKVKTGGGEFGPPEKWYPAGDIAHIKIVGQFCDVWLWNICSW